jgi:predicted secreted protein
MAQNEVNGRDMVVLIDPTDVGSFKSVVCLTSNSITNNLTELDASSKCGNKWVPGVKFDATLSGEGFFIDADSGAPTNQGYEQLYSLFKNRTIFPIYFGKAIPTTGDASYSGDAFVTNLELTAADDELTKFTVTFRAAEPPFIQTVAY